MLVNLCHVSRGTKVRKILNSNDLQGHSEVLAKVWQKLVPYSGRPYGSGRPTAWIETSGATNWATYGTSFYILTTGTGSQSWWRLPTWSRNVDKQYVVLVVLKLCYLIGLTSTKHIVKRSISHRRRSDVSCLRLPCSVEQYNHWNQSKSLDVLELLLLDYITVLRR